MIFFAPFYSGLLLTPSPVGGGLGRGFTRRLIAKNKPRRWQAAEVLSSDYTTCAIPRAVDGAPAPMVRVALAGIVYRIFWEVPGLCWPASSLASVKRGRMLLEGC